MFDWMREPNFLGVPHYNGKPMSAKEFREFLTQERIRQVTETQIQHEIQRAERERRMAELHEHERPRSRVHLMVAS